ncbi:MAG: hypothetical protein ACP5HZ_06300 [Ferrimicrobium sp.]
MSNQHVEVDDGSIRSIEVAAASSRSPVGQGQRAPGRHYAELPDQRNGT